MLGSIGACHVGVQIRGREYCFGNSAGFDRLGADGNYVHNYTFPVGDLYGCVA